MPQADFVNQEHIQKEQRSDFVYLDDFIEEGMKQNGAETQQRQHQDAAQIIVIPDFWVQPGCCQQHIENHGDEQ